MMTRGMTLPTARVSLAALSALLFVGAMSWSPDGHAQATTRKKRLTKKKAPATQDEASPPRVGDLTESERAAQEEDERRAAEAAAAEAAHASDAAGAAYPDTLELPPPSPTPAPARSAPAAPAAKH